MQISESPYKGSGQLTREQFLFYEMRTTARLMNEGIPDDEILNKIVEDNLFQYPTEKTIRQTAGALRELSPDVDSEDLTRKGFPKQRFGFLWKRKPKQRFGSW